MLEKNNAPTPYSSLNSSQMPQPKKKRPCCIHEKDCSQSDDDETNTYVNLIPKKNKTKTKPLPMEELSERKQRDLRRVMREMEAVQLGEPPLMPKETNKQEKSSPEGSQNKSQRRKENKFDTLSAGVKDKVVKTAYIGMKTPKEAEDIVSGPTDFRLYHRIGGSLLSELEPSLPLFIVYKTAAGKYQHFRVRCQTTNEVKTYSVEYGKMNAPSHPSLAHLIRFYHTQFFTRLDRKGQQKIDAFMLTSDSE